MRVYDQYLRGEVYGYVVKNSKRKFIDSCWGYLGDDGIEDAILSAKGIIDSEIRSIAKRHIKYLKSIIRNRVSLIYRKSFSF